jgi:hypothetical protein
MGTWDVMSSHYIEINSPPPGLSSFTRIRLGWISPDQAVLVNPGETRGVFLAPLERGGETLVVKIPLAGGEYYLVENRQRIGYDRVQPDSGLLVVRVNPEAREGTGTAVIMDADPPSPGFSHATFRPDREGRNIFRDRRNGLAVIPLWSRGEDRGVLVTTLEKSEDALKATQALLELWNRPPAGAGKDRETMEASLEAFRNFDFVKSHALARQIGGGAGR